MKEKFHYSAVDLRESLKLAGITKGDTVFCHSNVGFFGVLKDAMKNKEKMLEIFLEELMGALGPDGTLVVPSFTYSFCKNEVYSPLRSISECGVFSEYVRSIPEAMRSLDPNHSVSVLGKNSSVINDLPKNSFYKNSIFERLLLLKTRVLNFNLDSASTMVHYAERMHEVPYRFDKCFYGKIEVSSGELMEDNNTFFVRNLGSDYFYPSFENFHKRACEEGLVKTVKLGRGKINSMDLNKQYSLVRKMLNENIWSLTKGGEDGVPSSTLKSLLV